MRVLAVLYCFPPLLLPAALCYLKLVLGLRNAGAKVETLVIDPDSFVGPFMEIRDVALAALIPADLERHVVWSPESWWAVKQLKRASAVRPFLYHFLEPRKREWTHAALRDLSRRDLARYDLVLTCGQPHANHLIGLRLKEKLGIPWVAYFSDPWYRNPYARFDSRRAARYNRSLEERVLETADRVLYTSEEMFRLTEAEYPSLLSEKSGVVPHCFVPEWYDLAPSPDHLPSAACSLLHMGHFYGPRSPAPLLRALRRLQQRTALAGRLSITCYGTFEAPYQEEVERAGLEDVFEVRETVPYLESLALMRRHDGLLLIDAPAQDARESVFLPSKLVDYLGSLKPVLAITPIKGASARIVGETGGEACDVSDDESIDSLLHRIVERGIEARPRLERIQEYDYRRVGAHLLAEIELALS